MTGKDNRIDKILAATSLRIHPQSFLIASIPSNSLGILKERLNDLEAPFWSLSVEESETTLIIPKSLWTNLAAFIPRAKIDEEYRVVTLDVDVSWDVPGYITKIVSILTQEGISTGVISGYTRNHLIIKNKDLMKAFELLNNTIETSQ